MKSLYSIALVALFIAASGRSQDLFVYEDFGSYSPGSIGSSSGWDLQTNLVNLATGGPVNWYHAANAGIQCIIQPNDLAIYTGVSRAGGYYPWPGLASAGSPNEMYATGNANSHLKFGGINQTNGAAYFSCIWHADQGAAFAEDYQTLLGFTSGNSVSNGGVNVLSFNLKVCAHSIAANDTYNLGIFKGSNSQTINVNSSNGQWATAKPLVRGQAHFIVACYKFNSGTNLVGGTLTNDDVVSLWIDPDPATFGASELTLPPPDAGGMVTNWCTNSTITEFTFRSSGSPASKRMAELRIGRTWASVTPRYHPILNLANNSPNVTLSWPAKDSAGGFGYHLRTSADFTTWTPDPNSPSLNGTNNVVTELPSPNQYWQLVYPPRSGVFGQY